MQNTQIQTMPAAAFIQSAARTLAKVELLRGIAFIRTLARQAMHLNQMRRIMHFTYLQYIRTTGQKTHDTCGR